MKILKIIENCGDCPCHYMSSLSENITYCKHEDNQYDVSTGGEPAIPDFPNIPQWCLLEDGLTPALDILQKYLDNESWVQKYSNLNGFPNYYHLVAQDGFAIASGATIKELLNNLIQWVT